MSDVAIRVVIGFMAGWFIGFMMARAGLKEKYNAKKNGILRLAYDQDDPFHPAMGLEIESLDYILNHDSVFLKIVKIGFPSTKKPVYLESHKDDKSA